jgi:trehalose synthase
MPPAIDAFAVKNEPLSQRQTRSTLQHIGLLAYRPGPVDYTFERVDGTTGRVHRRAELVQTAPVPHWSCPLIVQVSRWDPLKDMEGVMAGFVRALGHLGNAHLALVGPEVSAVSDDPEGQQVLERCVRAWHRLPASAKERVHLVCLPMEDVEENAAMVNAIQRHATIVVQKSLQEGFGLTVTEAMWKGRAVVASAVGGIQDQIDDGVHGMLLEKPSVPTALGDTLARLLQDGPLLRRLGRNARRRAANRFLGPRQTMQTMQLLQAIDGNGKRRQSA